MTSINFLAMFVRVVLMLIFMLYPVSSLAAPLAQGEDLKVEADTLLKEGDQFL